jgi:hypothetical protein
MRGAVMRVFVLDKNLKPLDPCHPARARELLKKGRAKVFKRYPFTIVLQDRMSKESTVHPHRIKIDPGSKTSGLAVVQEQTGRVTNALEISHRGKQIKEALESRRALRRGRRNRKTRYRKPRFLNRTRKQNWLPPSLESRIAIRFRPSFVLQLPNQKFDVHPKYLKTIHKADGYEYQS